MEEMRVVFAGFGGQGLLFAGKVVAYAGLIEDREVSWLPSYGPEMRGGTANCSVTVSDEPIGSPLIMDPTALIAMNQPSLLKFEETVVPGGIILADTSLITRIPERDDITVFELEATNMAEDAGLKGLANIVLVGKLLKETGFCSVESIEAAIRKAVPPRKAALIEKNLQALKLGMEG
ncbi:MAG: 2-oxoacid:acceptor oxidoreductase family protein [Eggerthellaceae bacterium]|nr:2-oxoacid:acceptor oxidoreductase family protein [Eggerthellaceae bacterium]